MTELRERIERWCREESLEMATARDDEGGFDCNVSLFGEPSLAISIRSAAGAPGRLLVAHTFDFAGPDELAGGADPAERFVALCEAVALGRSALVECRPSWGQGRASAEVGVTVFAEGLTKQSFLTALDEVRKVGLLLERELQAASMSAGVMAEVQGIVEQSSALASTVAASAAAGAEEAAPPMPEDIQPVVEELELAVAEEIPAAVAEPPPPAAEEMPAAVAEPPPSVPDGVLPPIEEPQPAPMATAPSESAAERFCTNCGAPIRGRARFCRTCGARLEDE